MKNILISGALGYLGCNLAVFLAKNFPMYNIIAVDNESDEKYIDNKKILENYRNINYIKHDISDHHFLTNILSEQKSVFSNYLNGNIDIIYAFAFDSKLNILNNNSFDILNNLKNILEVAIQSVKSWFDIEFNNKKIIYISSYDVYGNNKNILFTENDCINPESIRAGLHASNELILKTLSLNYGLPIIIFRIPEYFGPNCKHNNIPTYILKKLINNEEITLSISLKSEINLIFIEDLVYGLENGIKVKNRFDIFNLGGYNISIEKFIEIAKQIIYDKFKIKYDKNICSNHDKKIYSNISSDKALRELNWKNYTELEDAIEKTVSSYLNNI
ncbi:NAD(P)-dependent oxidoreductase [Deferribacter thermophilus]|uniref:NAD-dependent epimerase/dehydratase family protein n=1 Tax=Deferribacter thermophilus TaxID=53573 RepID=UPI003C18CC39